MIRILGYILAVLCLISQATHADSEIKRIDKIHSGNTIIRRFLYNPVGFWKFDEGSGTIANDASGNGNNGTITGATWTDGKIAKGLSFDGVGDQVVIPNISVTNQISVSVWMKMGTSTPSVRHVVSRHPGWFISSNIGSSTIRFAIDTGSEESATFDTWENIGTSEWHHYVGVYNGSTIVTYFDGTLKNTVAKTGNISLAGNSRIGTYWNGSDSFRWIGLIDQVYIYNRALTADEVKRLYFLGQ